MLARTRKPGFTLVEILIVVIILGILAAIVIPQFTNASQDARESALLSQLQTLRSQIELYKLQHFDKLPDLVTNWNPMTTKTDANGAASVNPNDFGPYIPASSRLEEKGEHEVRPCDVDGQKNAAPPNQPRAVLAGWARVHVD